MTSWTYISCCTLTDLSKMHNIGRTGCLICQPEDGLPLEIQPAVRSWLMTMVPKPTL